MDDIIYTPVPVVWGWRGADNMEFWWCVELDRVVFHREGSPYYNLGIGHLCDEHGLDHVRLIADEMDLEKSLEWVTGEREVVPGELH
jgi:hypothetical protein